VQSSLIYQFKPIFVSTLLGVRKIVTYLALRMKLPDLHPKMRLYSFYGEFELLPLVLASTRSHFLEWTLFHYHTRAADFRKKLDL
jgi:hypothetical protein